MARCVLFLVLLGVLASWWFASGPVNAATVDLPTYVQRLTTARDAITQAKNQAGTQREASIRRATDALADIDNVVVDGTTYDPQLADTLDTLRRPAPDLDRALTTVTTLRDTAEVTRAAPPAADARRTLDEVLASRDFRRAEPNWLQQQLINLRMWIREQWNRLTEPLPRVETPDLPAPETVPGGGGLAALLAALASPPVLITLLVLVAAFVLYLIWRGRRVRKVDTNAVPERTAQQWRDHAAALAAAGDYRAAVRALFLGTLRDLDERKVVPFDASRTDREYVRAVTERGDWLAEPVRPFVRLVEGIFYGGVKPGQSEYAQARQHADAVRAVATGAGAGM